MLSNNKSFHQHTCLKEKQKGLINSKCILHPIKQLYCELEISITQYKSRVNNLTVLV